MLVPVAESEGIVEPKHAEALLAVTCGVSIMVRSAVSLTLSHPVTVSTEVT